MKFLTVVLWTSMLAACGGGGGGDTSTSSLAPSPVVLFTAASVYGVVVDHASNAPLPGATVSADGKTTTSDSGGNFLLENIALGRTVVSVLAADHADKSAIVNLNANQGSQRIELDMVAIGSRQTFDATTAQTLTDSASQAAVTLSANALRTSSGSSPVGNVTVEITRIDPGTDPATMPGDYSTASSKLQSFGAASFRFLDSSGSALNLASGKTASIRIPVASNLAAPPTTTSLYSFDKLTGLWNQEGTATLAGAVGGAYYEATVSHFSTWNADQVINTVQITGTVVDEFGKPMVGVTVAAVGVNYIGYATAVTDATGSFSVPAKSASNLKVFAYLNDAQTPEKFGTTSSSDYSFTSSFVLPRAATAQIVLGAPKVTSASATPNPSPDPCCVFFKVEVPFQTTGMEILPIVHADGTTDGHYVNARWEFSSAVPLCDRPASGVGANCSTAWRLSYQNAPNLVPWNIYDGGGYLANKEGSTTTSTSGKLGFTFSYHNTNPDTTKTPTVYVLAGPAIVQVTAVLAVTVSNPVTATSITVKSKPFTISY